MTNDVYYISGIVIVFILIGALLPIIKAEFSDTTKTFDTESMKSDISTSDDLLNPVAVLGIGVILGSIGKMFFWTFGDLPVLLETIVFLPIRVILGFLIYRSIRSGGG